MPEVHFRVRWPDGGLDTCYSPSTVIKDFFVVGQPYPLDEFLELRGSSDAISDCTSSVFEGLMTMADPEASWVAKWQRLQGYVPGTYAVKVVGVVSEDCFASGKFDR